MTNVIDLHAVREAKGQRGYMEHDMRLYSIMEPAVLDFRDSGYSRAVIADELRYWASKFEQGDI